MADADDTGPEGRVDSQRLREVMRRFATGVAIVAAIEDEVPWAAAVNSFTSVSLTPPLILVCLQTRSRTCEVIGRTRRFSVCVLAERHEEYSRRFAISQPTTDDPALEMVHGLPVVRDCLAGMICGLESMQRKGDHTIVIGEVAGTHHEQDTPLLFYNSDYHRLAADPSAEIPGRVSERK